MRLISHRDLIRTVERLLRRAELPLARTEGFHPRPRMSFPSALAVGIAGTDEVLEIELSEAVDPADVLNRLSAHSVPGLRFLSVAALPPGARAGQARRATYEIEVPRPRRAELGERIAALLTAASWPVQRPHDGRTVDLREALASLALVDGVLRIELTSTGTAGVSPRLVLEALAAADLETSGAHLTRTAVDLS